MTWIYTHITSVNRNLTNCASLVCWRCLPFPREGLNSVFFLHRSEQKPVLRTYTYEIKWNEIFPLDVKVGQAGDPLSRKVGGKQTHSGNGSCYSLRIVDWNYFDLELCWYNYCKLLNKIIMTLYCLVSNPLRKQMFHQDYLDLCSLIFIIERFFKFWYNSKDCIGIVVFCIRD